MRETITYIVDNFGIRPVIKGWTRHVYFYVKLYDFIEETCSCVCTLALIGTHGRVKKVVHGLKNTLHHQQAPFLLRNVERKETLIDVPYTCILYMWLRSHTTDYRNRDLRKTQFSGISVFWNSLKFLDSFSVPSTLSMSVCVYLVVLIESSFPWDNFFYLSLGLHSLCDAIRWYSLSIYIFVETCIFLVGLFLILTVRSVLKQNGKLVIRTKEKILGFSLHILKITILRI